ncbi:MAG: CHAT domain-containing protein [Saprospiraceae bacterium]
MPVTLLLLTANDTTNPLPLLTREGKDIQRLLNSIPRKSYEVVLSPESGTADIVNELNVPGRQVEVLHYAGHANSTQLQLTDVDADATALADKLRSAGTIKLIFINGCASQGQVQFFHNAGIPFVIATTRPVDDMQAFWVATQFYQYLSLGRTLKQAFAEVVIDARLQQKGVDLATRGLALRGGAESDGLPWGLYLAPGAENEDYSLPFSARSSPIDQAVSHTVFLDTLIYALEKTEAQAFASIRRLAETMRRSPVPDGKKLAELTKALPFTLGVRIRQITFKAEETSDEYYRELLYDYCILFETLLHHVVSILSAQLWQHKVEVFQHPPPEKMAILDFWRQNRLLQPPQDYALQIDRMLAWANAAKVTLPFSPRDVNSLLEHLHSEDFEAAADFFHRQKMLHRQRVRLAEAESLETCYYAQQHIGKCFQALHFVATSAMASVRGVNVVNFRHVPLEIDNMVSLLTLSEFYPTVLSDKSDKKRMLENKSVLIYPASNGELEDIFEVADPLSLFPFVIDRNVFTGKPNTEVDLYLFIGYFPDPSGRLCFHFFSVQSPEKIWAFDDTQDHVYLLHLGEQADETHKNNHLMANAGEFRSYLSDLKLNFLTA